MSTHRQLVHRHYTMQTVHLVLIISSQVIPFASSVPVPELEDLIDGALHKTTEVLSLSETTLSELKSSMYDKDGKLLLPSIIESDSKPPAESDESEKQLMQGNDLISRTVASASTVVPTAYSVNEKHETLSNLDQNTKFNAFETTSEAHDDDGDNFGNRGSSSTTDASQVYRLREINSTSKPSSTEKELSRTSKHSDELKEVTEHPSTATVTIFGSTMPQIRSDKTSEKNTEEETSTYSLEFFTSTTTETTFESETEESILTPSTERTPTSRTEGTTATRVTEGTTPTPPAEGTTATPPTKGTTPTPSTEGTTATPSTEETTPTSSTEGTTSTPPAEVTTTTPPTEGTTPTPSTEGTTPIPPTEGTTATPPTEGTTPTPSTEGTTAASLTDKTYPTRKYVKTTPYDIEKSTSPYQELSTSATEQFVSTSSSPGTEEKEIRTRTRSGSTAQSKDETYDEIIVSTISSKKYSTPKKTTPSQQGLAHTEKTSFLTTTGFPQDLKTSIGSVPTQQYSSATNTSQPSNTHAPVTYSWPSGAVTTFISEMQNISADTHTRPASTTTPAAISAEPRVDPKVELKKGMSVGGIVGIAVTVLALTILISGSAFALYRRRRTRQIDDAIHLMSSRNGRNLRIYYDSTI